MFAFTLHGLTPVKAEPYPFTELQRNWLDALRSGKYEQGQGFLKDKHNRYCCLGVLCELAGLDSRLMEAAKAFQWKEKDNNVFHFSTGFIPSSVRALAGLYGDLGHFTQGIKFPGIKYGPQPDTMELGIGSNHCSLGAMNDARCLDAPGNTKRAFNFKEIADYIEFDPWNVFKAPEDMAKEAALYRLNAA